MTQIKKKVYYTDFEISTFDLNTQSLTRLKDFKVSGTLSDERCLKHAKKEMPDIKNLIITKKINYYETYIMDLNTFIEHASKV